MYSWRSCRIGGEEVLEFIIKYWLEVAFGLVCSAFVYVFTRVRKLYKKQKSVENGVLALLRNEMIKNYREYETRGELTILDKENIEHLFKEYKNLGGNGTVECMYKDLMKLETKIVK